MKLFKGKIDVGQTFETVTKGVDKTFFSQEERADLNKGIADAQVDYIKTTVSENSARSVTRRYLALAIMGVFLALVIMAAVVFKIDSEWSQFILDICTSKLGTLSIMVAAFFFGGYYAKKFVPDTRIKREKKTK